MRGAGGREAAGSLRYSTNEEHEADDAMNARNGLGAAALLLWSQWAGADADAFGAMPGLWKIQYNLEAGQGGKAPEPEWRCVDETADPWVGYADLPAARVSCKAAHYERTLTSLKWKVACGATPSEGALVFDSPRHYSGSISRVGGDGVRRRLHVEGERRAACTSPAD